MTAVLSTSSRSHVEPAESTPSAGSTPTHAVLAWSGAQRPSGKSRLAMLRSAGLVRRASERVDEGIERTLPVTAALRPLLPGGCLRRGGTVAVGGVRGGDLGGNGATSLLFALLAEASAAGSWCAVVGLPGLGLVAAAETGVAVDRLALIPRPGPDWVDTVGALLDGMDIVVIATPAGVPAQLATRLAAKTRQRGAVLIPVGAWPGADITFEVGGGSWHGLGQGLGRLRRREVEVVVHGRGAATRARRAHLWLPGPQGAPTPMAPTIVPATAGVARALDHRELDHRELDHRVLMEELVERRAS
jgi:hypothetical protein